MQQENSNDNSVDKDIEAQIDVALQHYREGQLQQAQDECLRILRQQHRSDAILILAMIAHEQREFEVAVGRYQQFLEIIPDHAQTHFHLGVVHEELGRTETAIDHYKQSITNNASDAAVHRRMADACSKLQRWEEAIKAYQQVLIVQPEDVGAMIRLGNAFTGAQFFADSILMYERALTFLPDNAVVYRNLGASLQRMGQLKRAKGCFERALRLRPEYVTVRIDLARALRKLGKAKEALIPLQEAINLKPDNAEAHFSLASAFKELGQPEITVKQLEQFLAIRPTCGEAYYRISMISPKQELIPVVQRLLDDPELPKDDAIYCHFALGNIFDNGKSYDQAFRHFLSANRLQRETFTYDIKESSDTVDRLIAVYSKDYFRDKRDFGSDSQLPVFIVGMPRSGTTLIEQILSSHALIHGAGEVEAFQGVNQSIAHQLKDAAPAPECMSFIDRKMAKEHAARYLREMTYHCPTAARIIDKLPGNFVRIGVIKTLFPDARIIHCQRNPLDNCVSLFFHCFTPMTSSFDLIELGQHYLDCQRLMSHWLSLFPGEIFTVQYEDLVVNQEKVSKQLVDYLGLDWDEECLTFHDNERNVMSPSSTQVRQPMYKSSMNRWKLYEKHLRPLINVLQQAS